MKAIEKLFLFLVIKGNKSIFYSIFYFIIYILSYIFVDFWIFLYLKCSLLSLKWLLVFIVFPYFPRNTKTQGRGWVVKIYKPPFPEQG